MNPTTVKSWLQRGELEKLENIVLEGRGARLLGEYSPDLRTRVFLKGLPNYLTKISHLHDAVSRGSLQETQRIISDEPKKKLAIAKDPTGTPLLHKAVYYDHLDVTEWLIQNYPDLSQLKDKEGRISLHYCSACSDPEAIWDVLIDGGCDASICDKRGNPAAYYLEHASEIELPEAESMSRRKTICPKECLDFKPSNIRIWIHNRDIGKLQQVLWEGHGMKLRCETSNNPRVRRFLEAVPFIMGTVKDVHAATVKNDLEGFRKKLDSVSPVVLCSKDNNGLNVLHKAAGLGYMQMARDIIERCPATVEMQDNEGKTPLHYAAALKDDDAMYNLLTENGADESKLDNRQKAAAFYKNRPSDVDLTNLVVVPEAPRVASTSYPKNWDWRILEAGDALMRGVKKAATSMNNFEPDSAFGSAETTMKSPSESHDEETQESRESHDEENQASHDEENQVSQDEENQASHDRENQVSQDEDNQVSQDEENQVSQDEEAQESSDQMHDTEDQKRNEDEQAEAEPLSEGAQSQDEQEEKSSDDDVVTGMTSEETGRAEEADQKEEEQEEGEGQQEEGEGQQDEEEDEADELVMAREPLTIEEIPMNEETNGDQEERNDPSTGDSGVDDPGNDEDQVIAGEHEELPETELNDGSMAVDPEVEGLLENGNMEQLAALVLNGEGRRLVGRHSNNPELQAFIDNVPAYMGKIHAVHMAAREGNLRDLQSALDRRKFAIARDGSSPHGATPLHVAVIFGNTAVIRYLAGRFPETAHAIDLDGRTPLHYAATLADNGHYYNLLLHLGANPLIQDNFGQTADYYKENQNDLSHKKLLRDFGASEKLAEEMLTDKDDSQLDIPIFRTEEGRYLASSLGDPLIKGLTEVAHHRPNDPVTYLATYLYNFASKNKSSGQGQESNVLILPERENEDVENLENENPDEDAGYPQSPDSDVPESTFSNPSRDEHGQSMIHFAAVRAYSKDGLYHLLQETQVNVGFRDELYRTARDVAQEANIEENVEEIDRWVVYLAARGETEKLVELLLESYDHILDAKDDGADIVTIAAQRNHEATVQFLQSIPNYVTQREEVHHAIRLGNVPKVKESLNKKNGGGKLLAVGKNVMGRCALHIAVLRENEELVRFIAKTYPETLRIGDNLERTALHYAMGVPSVEILSNILIKAGAKRIVKDLKSRQPSYYFMNKSDIEKLQAEEEAMAK